MDSCGPPTSPGGDPEGPAQPRERPSWQKQCQGWGLSICPLPGPPSEPFNPQPFSPRTMGHDHCHWGQRTQAAWGGGELGGGPAPLCAHSPHSRAEAGGGSPGSGGVKGPRAPGSFGEDTVAGLQEASQDPQLTGTATHWGTVWHGGAPEGLVQTDWRTRDSGPSRAAWQEQRPPHLFISVPSLSTTPWASPSPFGPGRVGGRPGQRRGHRDRVGPPSLPPHTSGNRPWAPHVAASSAVTVPALGDEVPHGALHLREDH